MKLSILIFLAVFAVATNAFYFGAEPIDEVEEYWGPGSWGRDSPTIEPLNAVTDKIKAAIEKLLKTATESFEIMANKMKALMGKMNEEAGALVMKAKDRANVVKGEIEAKMNEMKERGGEVAACAKALEPEYWQVEKDLMTDVKKCAGDIFIATEEMKNEVSHGMTALKNAVRDLREMVGDCIGWNPINVAKCIKEKTDEFKKVFDGVMSSISSAYKAAQAKANEIMDDGRQCNVRALENAKARIAALNERLTKCYKFYDEIIYY